MKTIKLFFRISLLLSFSLIFAQKTPKLSSRLQGEWQFTKTVQVYDGSNGISEQTEALCNQCPRLIFSKGNAILKKPDGTEELYSYDILDNAIIFIEKSKAQYPQFVSGEKLKLTLEKDELRILKTKGQNTTIYVLGKL